MANLRDLKKDIDYLVGQVVMDCFSFIHNNEKANSEAVYDIIGEALVLRNQLRKRANHPDGKDNPGMNKKYYTQIGKALVEGCDECYTKLGKIAEA